MSDIIIQVPTIDPKQLYCTCGADKDGFVPFWMHKYECIRYRSIVRGFRETIFEDKELENEVDDNLKES